MALARSLPDFIIVGAVGSSHECGIYTSDIAGLPDL